MAETQGLPSGSFPSNRGAGNEPLQWEGSNAVASLAYLWVLWTLLGGLPRDGHAAARP